MKTLVFDFDDEVHIDLLGVEVLNEFVGCLRRSTRCEQIVVDEYYIILFYGVDVHLDGVDAIFLRERFLDDCCW